MRKSTWKVSQVLQEDSNQLLRDIEAMNSMEESGEEEQNSFEALQEDFQ
jgi:hypothetical protein